MGAADRAPRVVAWLSLIEGLCLLQQGGDAGFTTYDGSAKYDGVQLTSRTH